MTADVEMLSPEEFDDLRQDTESNLPIPKTYYPRNLGIPNLVDDGRAQGRKTFDAIQNVNVRLKRMAKLANTIDRAAAAVERSMLENAATAGLLPGSNGNEKE